MSDGRRGYTKWKEYLLLSITILLDKQNFVWYLYANYPNYIVMRTLALSVIILSYFSITTFSQILNNNNSKQSLDIKGEPLKKTSIKLNAPYSSSNVMTEYAYDSIRELTEINDPNRADAYPWISSDGLRLYYTGMPDGNKLMFTQRPNMNGYFISPTVIPINSVLDPRSCWLSTDELDIYLTSGNYLYYAHRDAISLPFNTPFNISLFGTTFSFISGPSLNTAQDELFLFSSGAGIIKFSRSSPTSFNYTGTLPRPSGYSIRPGQLAKDDLTFFFGAQYNYGKTLLYQMTRATPTDIFDISTFQQIQGINYASVNNHQPSMSDSLDWVAFVRSTQNLWNTNDLFIAYKGKISSVFDPDDMQIYSYAFPNPSSEYLIINYKSSSTNPLILSIFSCHGALIYENMINPSSKKIKIDTKKMNNGFYVYRLTQSANKTNGFETGSFIVLH